MNGATPATKEDDAGATWAIAVAVEWADELSDTGQDIYSLDDGEALDQA